MLDNQLTMDVSPYSSLYNIVVPKTHFLRQLTELCDFSFIYDELEKNYRPDFGRKAYSPIMMFKYLLLKDIYKLSDVDVVERSLSDMAFKFFLGLAPEDSVIEPSSLTKFRKLRIKDDKLLDVLIQKSVQIALEHNLIKSKILIVDATHTKAHYNHKKPQEVLRERSKALRKTIYQHSEDIKIEFPKKPQEDNLEAELTYTEELMAVVEKHEELLALPAVSQKFNYLKEAVEDDLEHLEASVKEEARLGHKTADSSFYGYKSHIAMTDERIITACVVTHYFDIEKCKSCLSKEGCYKEGAKSKTYSIAIKSDDHLFQKKFQETPYFKEMARHRYKIEAKNAELKQRHGFDVARASGLFSMELQAATTIFVVNMKRIMTLINTK